VISHTSTVQVRWGDVDAAGIAFYPRFYEWYDSGCEALFAALGLPWPELFPRHGIVGVPIVESGARFAAPVRYPGGRLVAGPIPEDVARRLRGEPA
jgi:4-hydroxybenzoyl-CoA thioesterase